jgi:hypothetical protein
MYSNLRSYEVGDFGTPTYADIYWSSTESNAYDGPMAWGKAFYSGSSSDTWKDNEFSVRAARAF